MQVFFSGYTASFIIKTKGEFYINFQIQKQFLIVVFCLYLLNCKCISYSMLIMCVVYLLFVLFRLCNGRIVYACVFP